VFAIKYAVFASIYECGCFDKEHIVQVKTQFIIYTFYSQQQQQQNHKVNSRAWNWSVTKNNNRKTIFTFL